MPADATQEIVLDLASNRLRRRSDEVLIPAVAATTSAIQAIATAGTVDTTQGDAIRLTVAAASTGVIMRVGLRDGQIVIVYNEDAANSVTMAAAGTSNVANGVANVLAALTCKEYIWNNAKLLWYSIGG